MVVSVGREVRRHLHREALVVLLIYHLSLRVELVCLRILDYGFLYKSSHFLADDSVNDLVYPGIYKAFLFINILLLDLRLQGCVLDEDGLRFEGVNQLLAEGYALLAVMLAAKENDNLLSLFVFHNDNSILKIEVH
jgi:hypothetical protein